MNDHGIVWRAVCRVLVAAIALAGLSATGTAGAAGPPAVRAAAQSGTPASVARPLSVAHAASRGRASFRTQPSAASARGTHTSQQSPTSALNAALRRSATALRTPLMQTPRIRRVRVAPSTPRVIYQAPAVSARVSGVRPHISCPSDVWEGPPFLNRYDNFQDNGHGVCVLVSTTIHDTTLASLTLPAETNLMEANVTVASGNVVNIPTGASLQVSGGGSLVVEGTLNATGTSTQPITLTTGGSPGSWGGVQFVPGSAGTLNFVHLSFAGKNVGVPTVGCCFQTAVLVDGANPAITNSTIDDSSNNGIEVFNSGDPTVTGDALLNNAGWPLRYDFMPSTSFVNNGLSASGNGGGDAIDVAGGATNGLTVTTPGIPFRFEGSLTINPGAQMTIGAGTVVQDNGNGLITAEGTLNAVGTGANPISLTNTNPVTASWGGVAFVPGGAGTLNHVHLSFTGANDGVPTVGCCFRTGVLVDGAYPTITNSTIDVSGGNGVEVFGSGEPSVTNDSIVNNAGWPLRYDFTPSISLVNNGLSASGNGNGDVIDLAGGAVTSTLSLTTPGLPVRLEGSITVNPGATFAIGPGTIVQDNGNGLITAEGTFNAVGTAASPISLTNTNPAPGSWGGIDFVPGGAGTLNHVHLSFTGANDGVPTVGCCFRTAVFVDGAYPTITNSTIDFSNGNGVEVFNSGEPSVTNDSIVNNAGFPFKYDFTPSINLVNNGIAASGNGSGDVIDLASGAVTSTLTVGNPGLPLRLEGNITVNAGAQFNINPGMVVQDNGNGQIVVQGTLNAIGTAASPISLTNTNPAPGSWGGIDFISGGTGTVSFVHLSFAGANDGVPTIGCCFRTAIFVNGSNPAITNSTIDNSGGNGVEVYTSGNPTVTNDSIVNNGLYPLRYDATPNVSLVNNHISASGNASGDVVDIAGGTLTGALTLATPGLPIRFEGNVTVNSGAQLTVGHGTIVQDNGNGQYVVFGAMVMSGTAASPISLTNTNATAGSWGGLVFLSGSSATLNYVHLSFAGANVGVPTIGCCFRAEVFVDNATPTINNSTIDNSGGNDMEVRDGGLPVLHGDNFGAVPGSEFGVLNDSGAAGPSVDARDDWWGSASGPSGVGPGTGVPVSAGVTFSPFLGSAPGSHAPALTRSRVSGVWKDTLTITGTNFGADEPINVYFDTLGSTPITSTTAGPGGGFVVTFVVPQAISGTHTISATGGISGLRATTPFLIRPSTFLLHYQGNKGTVNVLKGTGFAPGETVVGYWNSLSGTPFTMTATTNSLGTFGGSASFPGITFTVPLSPTGTYKVFGVGQSSGGVAFSTFVLKPHLQVTPSSGPAGSTVKVAATGYGANETVTIKYNCGTPGCSSSTVVATPTTDANGFFSVLVTLPSPSSLGSHAIGGTGTTSGVFATANFTVTS